jgi:hypothetical protein
MCMTAHNMYKRAWLALGVALLVAAGARAESLAIKATAEIEIGASVAEQGARHLQAARLVVPGDRLIYTLEARNVSGAVLKAATIDYAIPAHVQYLADTAVGPGSDVSFSVDGGAHFARAERLRIRVKEHERAASPADYTHIRWQLRADLKAQSTAYVRFRAVVK